MTADRSPALNKENFYCPHCEVYAHQVWNGIYQRSAGFYSVVGWLTSTCASCGEPAFWLNERLIYPDVRLGRPPHADMPNEVKALYDEARDVSGRSRKSAAALLRLALQHLIDDLEPGTAPINDKIGALVKRGLHPDVQRAMDVLRVVGNNAVHPGEIDLDADDELLPSLFELLNLVVEQVVTRPKQVASLFGSLPAGAQAAVAKRDATQP